MKYDLVKFHHWLLLSTFKNKWFEENIKLQIISLLSWMIYPEYREQNSLIGVIQKNKFILSVIVIPMLWSCTFFTFGRLSSTQNTIVIEKKTFINNHLKGVDFNSLNGERKFIEYLAHTKFKIENYKNLQKLPDEVFFTIVSEIQRNKIPASLFFRLLDQESGFRDIVNYNSGVRGIPQINSDTRRRILKIIGSTNHRIIDDIRVCSYHLKSQYETHKINGNDERKSWTLSLVDYNGGSSTLAKENMKFYHMELK
jgi:hypothetical protein